MFEALNSNPQYEPLGEPPQEDGTERLQPLDTPEQWAIARAQELEARRSELLLDALEKGKDPNDDPDYQFTLGGLAQAYAQINSFNAAKEDPESSQP